MRAGLYLVQFSLGPKDGRNGVGVIAGEEMLGGDGSHWWAGRVVEGPDGTLTADLKITSHSPGGDKVFGFWDSFDLRLEGQMKGAVAQLVGATVMAPDRRINMNLRPLRLADEPVMADA